MDPGPQTETFTGNVASLLKRGEVVLEASHRVAVQEGCPAHAGAASCEEGIDHGALTGAVALGAGNSAPLIRRRTLLASCLCEISSKHAVTVPLGSLAGPVGGDVLAVGAEGVAVAA